MILTWYSLSIKFLKLTKNQNFILYQSKSSFLTLHQTFQLISTNQCELLEWIDLLIHITGASRRLHQILDKFGPDLRLFHDEIQPKVEQLREMDANWSQVSKTMTKEQKREIERFGYSPMTNEQIELAYKHRMKDEKGVTEFLEKLKGGWVFWGEGNEV